MTRGVDDLLADLADAAYAAAEPVRLGKERWDTERLLRLLAGEAVIGRLGDIATKLPDEVIKATGAPDNSSAVTAVSAMVHVICAVSLRGA